MPRKTRTPDVTILRLEFLCAQKDAENAQVRLQLAEAQGQHVITHLRQALRASASAVFHPESFSFTEVA